MLLPFLDGHFAADKLTIEEKNVTLFRLASRWLNVGLHYPSSPARLMLTHHAIALCSVVTKRVLITHGRAILGIGVGEL